jgi:MtaA/CmuA family methyltransferase
MFFAQSRYGTSYREYCQNGRALAGAQLAIRDAFPIDAVTACSDAFRLTADLGAEMDYPLDRPPAASRPLIESEADLRRLSKPDPLTAGSRMEDRCIAVRDMADAAGEDCLVLGWVDMPFAEACSLCGVSNFMMMLIDRPELAHEVLEFATGAVIDFGLAQLEAGAPMIGAGDAAASLVSPEHYAEYVQPYEKRVVHALKEAGALMKLHICGRTQHLLEQMRDTGADLFNVDHLVDFDAACRAYGRAGKCFKGNLDPVAEMMQSTPEKCQARCMELMRQAQGLPYMLSAGCEIPAATSDEVFRAFCEAPQHMAKEAASA